MSIVPDGYPMDLPDEAIIEEMRTLAGVVRGGSVTDVTQRGPFIILGQNELTGRKVAATAEETRRSGESARRFSVLALAVATASVVLTLVFGVLDYQGDKGWQRDQLSTLRRIERRLAAEGTRDAQDAQALLAALTDLRRVLEGR